MCVCVCVRVTKLCDKGVRERERERLVWDGERDDVKKDINVFLMR